mgnify:CR=1 FL=1
MRRLRGYLTRVQKSVFEGQLADERLEPLRRMLLDEIDPVTDTVRIYHLCGRCIPATEVLGLGLGEFIDREDADEVI